MNMNIVFLKMANSKESFRPKTFEDVRRFQVGKRNRPNIYKRLAVIHIFESKPLSKNSGILSQSEELRTF